MICIIVPLPSLAHNGRPRRRLGFLAKSHDYEVVLDKEKQEGTVDKEVVAGLEMLCYAIDE